MSQVLKSTTFQKSDWGQVRVILEQNGLLKPDSWENHLFQRVATPRIEGNILRDKNLEVVGVMLGGVSGELAFIEYHWTSMKLSKEEKQKFLLSWIEERKEKHRLRKIYLEAQLVRYGHVDWYRSMNFCRSHEMVVEATLNPKGRGFSSQVGNPFLDPVWLQECGGLLLGLRGLFSIRTDVMTPELDEKIRTWADICGRAGVMKLNTFVSPLMKMDNREWLDYFGFKSNPLRVLMEYTI
jgi:hypothetical protein